MPDQLAPETAYYLHRSALTLALIGKGVRFPPGPWLRVADATVEPWLVEELVHDLFPSLRGKASFALLLTDFDVFEFERLQVRARPAKRLIRFRP
ncbi:MAG: hypothetical protein E6J65_25085 [Deltaproteobacteria bacterium]|jgi:hypothetical protein|nr:MAG: hypothetical protein E6J63_01820 [Deltaproteobacteria bacterium]TMB13613.1 MAG: hypothetical protein E6J65_25085 [Deltaproteobacteria bacterium]